MAFILRWPAILVLFALVFMSALAALAASGLLANVPIPQVQDVQATAEGSPAAQADYIEMGLLAGAAVFFLVSAIRLIRRTQGFWTWLLGFACYGGQWAYAQHRGGGNVIAEIQNVDWSVYMRPAAIWADYNSANPQMTFETQVSLSSSTPWIARTGTRRARKAAGQGRPKAD
jgi:hypothetical protein